MKKWLTVLFIVTWPAYWAAVYVHCWHIGLGAILPITLSALGTFYGGWIMLTHPAYNKFLTRGVDHGHEQD